MDKVNIEICEPSYGSLCQSCLHIESQIQRVKLTHDKDIREGFGLTSLTS